MRSASASPAQRCPSAGFPPPCGTQALFCGSLGFSQRSGSNRSGSANVFGSSSVAPMHPMARWPAGMRTPWKVISCFTLPKNVSGRIGHGPAYLPGESIQVLELAQRGERQRTGGSLAQHFSACPVGRVRKATESRH